LGETIELEVAGAPGLWPIEVDVAQLEATLVNLAINARDAMPGGGKLTVEALNQALDRDYIGVVHTSRTSTGLGLERLEPRVDG
jgi:signal transduction histidine kinase